ncbi:hypothetical protein OV208_13575 [Corallococcus sp. bb12-1]|uniref:hypothetical protein n=1 Tax=Corallococcus sp. bb12-1 TaxID=2996784 RepID=UPI0022720B5D|nr:hypothetical protein [Corallococcus sp. bb12-1]MCY1042349.1 hypothetical protein [Corallococcus sp. bb12-1]
MKGATHGIDLDFQAQGVVDAVELQQVPMERWSVESWSLANTRGMTPAPVQVASCVPYSGMTSAQA